MTALPTMNELLVLSLLVKREQPPSVAELGREILTVDQKRNLRGSPLYQVVQRLEARGYISHTLAIGTHTRPPRLYRLTEKGRQKLAAVQKVFTSLWNKSTA